MTTTERTARPEIGGQEVDFQPSEMMTVTAGAVVETVMNHLEGVVDMIGVNNRAIQLRFLTMITSVFYSLKMVWFLS